MAKGSLTICGFGMDLNQMTLETVEALMRAEIVFSDALDEPTWDFIRAYCSDVRNLNTLAGEGSHNVVAPKKVAITLQAVADGKRVVVLNFGHPTFLSSLAQGLIDGCSERGFEYRVLNGISSLGAVLAQLELTGLWGGLHVYDADDFSGLITVVPLQPKVPTIIVKVGYLLKPEQKDRLKPFLARLCEFYPADHPVVLVECPWISNKEGRKVETTIANIGSAIENPNEFLTLFLPSLGALFRPANTGIASDIEPGRKLVDANDLVGAEKHFSELLTKDPSRVEAMAWRARVRMSMGHFKEALPDLDAALQRISEPGWTHQLRAESRLMTGDLEGCLEDVESARLWKDHGVQLDVIYSSVHLRGGDLQKAEDAMEAAIAKWGIDWAITWFWTYNSEIALQKEAELVALAERTLAKRKDREWMALLLGNWRLEENRPSEAIELLERAIRSYPNAKVPKERLKTAQQEAARA